jgi:outer membrane protein OmpA-like peptidoglycan-associated protein
MRRSSLKKVASSMVLGGIVLALTAAISAQNVKIEGLIIGNDNDQITVRFGSGAELTFVLTDSTEVSDIGRLSDQVKKDRATAVLIPGLKIKAEGNYNEARQVVATSIKFKQDDLEQAQTAQAAMHPVKVENAQQQEQLEEQNAMLKAQNEALQQQQAQLIEQQKHIEANKAAIAANTARFGQLDDYYIWDELTIYFGNGKVDVEPEYEAPLLALAEKAQTVDGYVIEVKGYASSAGSESLNQKLSDERANNVTNILIQQGHIPLTRMLAPGAMGESRQIGDSASSQGEAQNRRVRVRVLQNKAIAGATQPPAQ